MREIKFRAFGVVDGEKKKRMIYEGELDREWWKYCGGEMILVQQNSQTVGWVNNPIIMQYTGLKDKNGKEIYEGDILKYDVLGDDSLYEYLTVSYDQGSWIAETNPKNIDSFLSVVATEGANDAEVVGNIYENPELLKKEIDR